ncbi:hypothetical protein ABTW24_22715 [Sphingobacterium thalpophilum]|uniref:Uncharacterized protein n=1 Tax=Sphingobacterium thalpophilum TaxID=259 RepID=A0ABV4HIQ8_9SPHI
MLNLYWPIFKNIEKEILELSNQVHFDDNQLSIYSVKISELLIRCSVEIESISKDLFIKYGGQIPADEKDLYFDTDCLQLLEDKWMLSKKKVILASSNFYFQEEENKIIAPLHKANKRGTSGSDWKKAYQAVKHNRTKNLKQANLKNLIRALAALYILNIYYRDEIHSLKDGSPASFPISLGSDLFAIKIHNLSGYDGKYAYTKETDFDECMYFIKFTDDDIEKNKIADIETERNLISLLKAHPKYAEIIEKEGINESSIDAVNIGMMKNLSQDEYHMISRKASMGLLEVLNNTQYEAVLNKNNA